MNNNNLRWRRPIAAVALLLLICGMPMHAWCGDSSLWLSFDDQSGIQSYTSKQLKKSGMRTPLHLTTFGDARGLAFDKSGNLWPVAEEVEVVRFTAAQLKNLKKDPSPTPGVIITSMYTFIDVIGANFDAQGNLWVVDAGNDSIDELSKAQLAAGSGDVTPNTVITSPDLSSPEFVTFDKAGNAWVNSPDYDQIVQFSASQLASGGSKSATVVLSDDGSGTSLYAPGEIVFDKKGNLWVANGDSNTVVEYAKNQLGKSGSPVPMVKLSSVIFEEPVGAAFDSKGDLVILNSAGATIAKFTPKQLKASGAPVPKVTVTGTTSNSYQITFGP